MEEDSVHLPAGHSVQWGTSVFQAGADDRIDFLECNISIVNKKHWSLAENTGRPEYAL